jgi:capsular exopolysaccharide synthesis family protein
MARKKEQKILLLEGDLRRPVLANNLGLGNLTGLIEYVQSNKPVTHAVRHIEDLGFWILPAGHPPGNPVEIIQSVQLVQALEQLSSSFDWIIVDSPPLLPLADASVWARAVDGTLLVTRQGKTEKGQLKRGIEMLDKSNLVGVVINDCSVANQSNYYQRYGSPSSNSL